MDVNRLLEGFGVPVTILIVAAWGSYRGSSVFWRDLVIPFRDKGLHRLILFFDKLDATMDTTLARHAETKHQAERHEDVSWRILDEVEQVRAKCDQITERMGIPEPEGTPRRPRRRRARPAQSPPADPDATPPPS